MSIITAIIISLAFSISHQITKDSYERDAARKVKTVYSERNENIKKAKEVQ